MTTCWVCRFPIRDYQPVRAKAVEKDGETYWMAAHAECVEAQESQRDHEWTTTEKPGAISEW